MSEEPAGNGRGGLSFAVTLLAALGTILYAVYTYTQNTSIDPLVDFFICGFFSIAIILVFGLLLYILIKGYAIEVEDHKRKRWLNKRASIIYLIIFPVCTAVLILFLCVLVWVYLSTKLANISGNLVIGMIIWVITFIGVYIIFGDFLEDIGLFNNTLNKIERRMFKILLKFLIFLCIVGVLYMMWLLVFSVINTSTLL
jgi:hypothetical protein